MGTKNLVIALLCIVLFATQSSGRNARRSASSSGSSGSSESSSSESSASSSSSSGSSESSSSESSSFACPSLVAPPYGNLTVTGFDLGDTATTACLMGYALIGSPVRNCTLFGWDGTAADCINVSCPALSNPTSGYVSTPDGTGFQNEAFYTCCDTGFELSGDSVRSCLSTGLWSGTGPTCVEIDQCRDEGWSKAYQHDSSGVTISGSKEDLRNSVESGAEVRVLRSDYLSAPFLLTNVQNIYPVVGPENDTCAQSLMSITKHGLYNFQNGAGSWELSSFCTTGDWHTSRWKVGEHTFINETRENVGLTWFVRTRWRTQSIFSTSNWNLDAYNCLLRSIRSGHSFRIVGRDTTENVSYSFPVDNVEISADESVVGAMSLWNIGQELVTSPDRYELQADAFWQFTLHSTDGNRHTSSWEFGDHVKVNEVNDTVDMDWYSDPCWKEVYSHDQDGNTINGSLSDLVSNLETGHRVRLLYDDSTSIEADEIMIRNGHVCAQLVNHLSKQDTAHFTSSVHWFWQICCSTGTCNVARIYVGSSTTVSGPNPVKRAIRWFVDTRSWEEVLSVGSDGTVLAGDKQSLADSVLQGADVRYIMNLESLRANQNYSLIYTADNLEIDPTTNDTIAFHLRAMARNPSGSFEERYVTPLRWIFVLADTHGNVPVDFWKVGEHTQYNRGFTIDFPMKWFVNK